MEKNQKQKFNHRNAEVFISYSSRDRDQVLSIADQLESAGVRVWLDRNKIPGGTSWAEEIVRGIKNCKVLILMCSEASMRSRNVKQEIQLAWKYERSYLPLLLEPISFPEQVEYWTEGWQWVEVLNLPTNKWLPKVLQALVHAGVHCQSIDLSNFKKESALKSTNLDQGLGGLRSLAKFTDQIWPLHADQATRGLTIPLRGLGAPQDNVEHGFRLGDRVCLAIESEIDGHLLLLDEGPEEIIYCLCPSWFAPETGIRRGRSYLPQEQASYDSFVITGKPGREQLLAIITDEPLGLDWMPKDPKIPARVLNQADIDLLLNRLRTLERNRWTTLSTYFDVLA